jgi:hypothetical protein
VCTPTQWETKAAGIAHDRECVDHTTCIDVEWETKAAETHADRKCKAHAICSSDQFETKASGAHHDRECQALTTCSPVQWEVKSAAYHHDRVCVNLTTCRDDQWASTRAGAHNDRVCSDHTVCSGGQYESSAAGSHVDRVCKAHTECENKQWEIKAAGTHHNRACTDHTVCTNIEWETKAAGTQHDRECSAQQECKHLSCHKSGGMIFVSHHHKDHDYGFRYHHCRFNAAEARCICVCNSRKRVDKGYTVPQPLPLRPSPAPSPAPTPAPTPHPCADGTHSCDFNHGICVRASATAYECHCQPGFFGTGKTCDKLVVCGKGEVELQAPTASTNRACGRPSSCKEILAARPGAASGIYTITRPSDSSVGSVYCDMSTDGGGWTQCLNSAFIKGASALYTKAYAKVYARNPMEFYDWCPQLTGREYMLALAGEKHGIKAAIKFTDSRPAYAGDATGAGEWNDVGIRAKRVDTIAGALDVRCGGSGGGGGNYQQALNFWEYINPAKRGLRGWKRGHFYCHAAAADSKNVAVFGSAAYSKQFHQGMYQFGSGCNYGACPDGDANGNLAAADMPKLPVMEGVKGWSYELTSGAGYGEYGSSSWVAHDNMAQPTPAIHADFTQVFFR